MSDTEVSLAQLIINSYPKIEGGRPHPSSFVLYNNKFSVVNKHIAYACHSPILWAKDRPWDVLLTACVPRGLRYIRELIDGPFRNFKDLIEIKELNGKHYVKITGFDKFPANALYNFCIATRQPIEYEGDLERFEKMMDAGVPGPLAILISRYMNIDEAVPDPWDWVIDDLTMKFDNHSFLDPTSDWGLFLSGEPTALHGPFNKVYNKVTPANAIWGSDVNFARLSVIDKSVRQLHDHFNKLNFFNKELAHEAD
jgi:hypothetical protein